jgi:hypothetical protein
MEIAHNIHFKKKIFIICLSIIIIVFCLNVFLKSKNKYYLVSPYPNGKNYAFTITDDPDANSLEKIKPVYDYLSDVGVITTIAVFTFKTTRTNGVPDRPSSYSPGDTCERVEYLKYIKYLQKQGYEIAFHGPSWGNDKRELTLKGYESFSNHFGYYPKIYINHKENLENVYWGKKIASDPVTEFLLGRFLSKARINYSGEIPTSEYFWGDVLKEKTKYVRLFGTQDINTLKFNPSMPYHEDQKPYVNYWFSFSNGNGVKGFTKLLSKENIDRLAEERGSCILYTHFGHDFSKDGIIDVNVKKSIDMLVSKPQGWFVPASELLDRLLLMKKVRIINENNKVLIINFNSSIVPDVTIIVHPKEVLHDINGNRYIANEEGEIQLGNLGVGSCKMLYKNLPKVKLEETLTKSIEFNDVVYVTIRNDDKTELLLKNFRGRKLYDTLGNTINIFENGKIDISGLRNNKEFVLIANKNLLQPKNGSLKILEKYNLLFQRAITFYYDN